MTMTTNPSQWSENHTRAVIDRAREVVEAWETLPDELPDIEGLVPLNQAIMELRALVRQADR